MSDEAERASEPEAQPDPELVLGVLSRGRLEGLRRCVNSALTYAGVPIRVIVAFDADPSTYKAYKAPGGVQKLYLHPRHYYTRGMNALYEAIRSTGADIFGITNNDCEFVTPGWAKLAKRELLNGFEDGHGVVEMTNYGSLFSFVTRVPFIEERYGGELFNPAYLMYYADRERMKDLEADDLYIHPVPGFVYAKESRDEVKHEGYSFFDADKRMYYRLHPEDVEDIKVR